MTNTPIPPNAGWNEDPAQKKTVAAGSARRGHGGRAWSFPLVENRGGQPQDGATDTRKRLATINSQLHSNGLHEPDDAGLTGGTRSLDRRLLGLNVLATKRKTAEAVTAVVSRPHVA